MKPKRPVIYAFIDSQNLNLGTSKNLYKNKKLIYQGWKLDFRKFNLYLKNKLLRLIIPNVKSESSLLKKFQKFKTYLIFEKNRLEFKPNKNGRRGS